MFTPVPIGGIPDREQSSLNLDLPRTFMDRAIGVHRGEDAGPCGRGSDLRAEDGVYGPMSGFAITNATGRRVSAMPR